MQLRMKLTVSPLLITPFMDASRAARMVRLPNITPCSK